MNLRYLVDASILPQLGLSVAFCLALHVGRKLVHPTLTKLAAALGAQNPVETDKFATQTVNCLCHAASGVWLLKQIMDRQWLQSPDRLWGGYTPGASDELSFHLIYSLETGYHLQRLLSLLSKERKKDFAEMLLHHLVTVGLLFTSLSYGTLRVGMMVLCVHDLSDVFGCICKMASACNWKKTCLAAFFPMIVVWAYTRLYILPMYIIPAAALCPASRVFVACGLAGLCTLVGLNAYWFALFMRMLHNAVASKGKVVHDSQEDRLSEKEKIEPKTPGIPSDAD